MKKFFISLVLLISCAHYPKNGQVVEDYRVYESLAIDIVWQLYQFEDVSKQNFGPDFTARIYAPIDRNSLPPPIIYKHVECWDGRSFWDKEMGCVYGIFDPVAYTIGIAWFKDSKFSDTSFAHELCHAYYHDIDHSICHNDGGPVLMANKALREKGL